MKRRDFLRSAAAAGLAATTAATLAQKANTNSPTSKEAPISRPHVPRTILVPDLSDARGGQPSFVVEREEPANR
jgi:hypothetical protein